MHPSTKGDGPTALPAALRGQDREVLIALLLAAQGDKERRKNRKKSPAVMLGFGGLRYGRGDALLLDFDRYGQLVGVGLLVVRERIERLW